MKRSRLSEEQIIGILHEPLPGFGKSQIFNADLGSQFTSATLIRMLTAAGIRITKFVVGGGWTTCSSGYCLLKHEDIYLKGYADGREAKAGIGSSTRLLQCSSSHRALASRTPMTVWRSCRKHPRRRGCGYDSSPGQRSRLATYPSDHSSHWSKQLKKLDPSSASINLKGDHDKAYTGTCS
jgi:hypothetical protein